MKFLRYSILSPLIVLFLVTPSKADSDWRKGLYIGGSVGRSFTSFRVEDGPTNPAPWWGTNDYGNNNVQGVSYAGQVGYNYPIGDFVIGAEAEFGHGILNISSTDPANPGPTIHLNDRFYGDIVGKVGYSAGPVLAYIKGGYGRMQTEYNWHGPIYNAGTNDIKALHGRVYGAGVEYNLSPKVALKADYTRFDFEDVNVLSLPWTSALRDPVRLRPIDTVRIGVNYRFDDLLPASGDH